jgi:hypothetical protein
MTNSQIPMTKQYINDQITKSALVSSVIQSLGIRSLLGDWCLGIGYLKLEGAQR